MTELEIDLLRRATLDLVESIKKIEEITLHYLSESPEYQMSRIAREALQNYRDLGIDPKKY